MWVEKDDFFVKIYEKELIKNHFSVDLISNGTQLLRRASKKKPDLIILSLLLSEMNGFMILEELKSSPALQNIPIIIVSSLGEKQDVEQAWRLKTEAYFIKSHMKPSQLIHTIKKILSS